MSEFVQPGLCTIRISNEGGCCTTHSTILAEWLVSSSMVGKKTHQLKTLFSFNLEERVPENNLYRRLKEALNWEFLYEAVAPYYGTCGHQSIDPIVFFKFMLIGYLENLHSDRAIIRVSQLRLDILYFIDYDIDEELPWHSTLSRTRQRMPEEIFEKCFERVLRLCIEAGMVEGETQAIDAAYVAANACIEHMQPKNTQLDWQKYVQVIRNQDKPTAKENPSLDTVQALPKEEKRLRSNATHYSPTDGDARMAKKKGKPCRLYHLASMVVDTFRHVITHIRADFADEKDSRHLLDLVKETRSRLKASDINMYKALADAAFSSGSNYAALEAAHIEGYVALYGQYHKQREGFTRVASTMMLLGMYTSAVKVKSLKIRVSNLILATLTTSIAAVPVTVPVAFVARPYQKEMLW